MATHHLASWAHNLLYSDLPHDVVRSAVKTFYNWAGCAVGGSNHPATTIAVRRETSESQDPIKDIFYLLTSLVSAQH